MRDLHLDRLVAALFSGEGNDRALAHVCDFAALRLQLPLLRLLWPNFAVTHGTDRSLFYGDALMAARFLYGTRQVFVALICIGEKRGEEPHFLMVTTSAAQHE
jgi:hypothetical protein